jgi:predicted RND superfamily exporter protein
MTIFIKPITSIVITPITCIVFEQVMSYEKCRNNLRNMIEPSSEAKRSVQCEVENNSDSQVKIKVWIKIKKIDSSDKHGSIKEATRKSTVRTFVLPPHTKIVPEYKIETPHSPGLYLTTFVCHETKTARRTKKVIPTIKCIKEENDWRIFSRLLSPLRNSTQ